MKYNTLVIDPPWCVPTKSRIGRPNRPQGLPYETMTVEQIKNFPIKNYAEQGAHIYLWTTNKFIREAYNVFDSWGVNFHLMLVGIKPSGIAPNGGYVFGTEFCLMGFYGKPAIKWKRMGLLNWIRMFNTKGKHSSKPDEFYNLVSEMSQPPYIDIFSRKNREGWDTYGNEVGKFDLKEQKANGGEKK